ncbi:MAG: hypothetical protein LBR50_11200 [Tannerella sp.]|jgi:hypothetical protein|nr:hypothetical protein [Tannerella sp.]
MEQLYVGWTAPDEWTKYSVVVDRDGVYSVSLLYTSNRGGKIALAINDSYVLENVSVTSTYVESDTLAWRQWHHWNTADLGEVNRLSSHSI